MIKQKLLSPTISYLESLFSIGLLDINRLYINIVIKVLTLSLGQILKFFSIITMANLGYLLMTFGIDLNIILDTN